MSETETRSSNIPGFLDHIQHRTYRQPKSGPVLLYISFSTHFWLDRFYYIWKPFSSAASITVQILALIFKKEIKKKVIIDSWLENSK